MEFVPDKPQGKRQFVPDPGAPQPAPEKPFSVWDEIKKNPMLILPQGLQARGMEEASKLIERGAYKAGGAVTDLAAKVLPAERTNPLQSLIPTAPEVGYMANVGIQAAPVVAGAYLGSTSGSEKAEQLARRLVRSAIKPPSSIAPAKAEQAISTIIEKNIPTTNESMQALGTKSKGLDAAVDKLVTGTQANVPRSYTERHLISEINKARQADVTEPEVEKMISALDKYRASRPANMPVQLAHEAKKANYAVTGNRPYMQGADAETAMSDKIRMALARGQREATVSAVPETAPLLKEQADLINVMKVAGPRLLMEGNRNPVSFGSFSPSTARLAAWLIDRDAQSKGAAARLLHKMVQGKVPTAAGGVSGAALANQLGLGKREE